MTDDIKDNAQMPEKRDPQKLSMKGLDKDMQQANAATTQRFDKLEETVNGMAKGVELQMGEILKAISAKNNIHTISKDGVHVDDVYLKEDQIDIEFAKNNDVNADVETVRPGMTSIDSMEFQEKADQMRFDNEEIKIMVMPSASTYPDHTFFVGVNGIQRLIVRGKEQWLPRRYVEVLLRAKISTYGNHEVRNQLTNELEVKNPETKSHRYPLQIILDKNPLGVKWLHRVTNDTRC
tara:strand:+ start:35178 stop:35885 length:708 start_codon:yes stop_codon:yes gene_type:complete